MLDSTVRTPSFIERVFFLIHQNNWEVEWKFGLAVLEEQYARRHPIVIPYNLLTYPISQCYFTARKDIRREVLRKLIII